MTAEKISRRSFLKSARDFGVVTLATGIIPDNSSEKKLPYSIDWSMRELPLEFNNPLETSVHMDPNDPSSGIIVTRTFDGTNYKVIGSLFDSSGFDNPVVIVPDHLAKEDAAPTTVIYNDNVYTSFLLQQEGGDLAHSLGINTSFYQPFPNVSEVSSLQSSEAKGILNLGLSYKVDTVASCKRVQCSIGTGKKVDITIARYNLNTQTWEGQFITGTNNSEEEETNLKIDQDNAYYLDWDQSSTSYILRKTNLSSNEGIQNTPFTVPRVEKFFVDRGILAIKRKSEWKFIDWTNDEPTKLDFDTSIVEFEGIFNLTNQGIPWVSVVGKTETGERVYTIGIDRLTHTENLNLDLDEFNVSRSQSNGESAGFIGKNAEKLCLVTGHINSSDSSLSR